MSRLNRYNDKDLGNIPNRILYTDFGSEPEDVVELHIYSADNLIASDHDVEGWSQNTYNPSDSTNTEPHLQLNVHEDVRQFGFYSGRYNLQYNFFRNILSHEGHIDGLHIKEIGSSRTEVRLQTTSTDEDFLADVRSFKFDRRPNEYGAFEDFVLNFGGNVQAQIINWRKDVDNGIMLKLYEPLPKDIEVKDKVWIAKELVQAVHYKIKLIPLEKEGEGKFIPGPNFELKIKKDITPSEFHTWDNILGTNQKNKTDLLNKFVSGSDTQTDINVNYDEYGNFVHFSSAVERLENFKYKMRLMEAYSSSLDTIEAIPQYSKSTITKANENEWKGKIEDIKNGFDGYERYLFFQSSSLIVDSYGTFPAKTWPKTNAAVPYENAKVDSADAVAWFASQSNVALEYDTVLNEHMLLNTLPFHIREDKDNQNFITFVNMTGHHFDELWTYISHSRDINSRENPLYEGISKDIIYNVLASFGWESFQGFHFNDLWEYALGVDGESNYGMENDWVSAQMKITNHSDAATNNAYVEIIHHAGKPPYTYDWDTTQAALTGFTGDTTSSIIGPLQAGGQIACTIKDTDNSEVTIVENVAVIAPPNHITMGSINTNSNSTGSTVITLANSDYQKSNPMSREEMSRETWKRMLNNIPLLLKTKGSERGIKALITTYGLPPTLLRVFEYGGPRKTRTTGSYVKYDKFSYSLEFEGSQNLQGPWKKVTNHPYSGGTNRTPDSVEMRFNTWTKTSQSLMSFGTNMGVGIVPHPSASNKTSDYYNFGAITVDLNNGASGIATSSYLPIYDNDWWNVFLSRTTASYNGGNHIHVALAKSPDHANARITHTSSMYVAVVENTAGSWNKQLTFRPGGNNYDTNYAKYSGSMQEVRFWMFEDEVQTSLDEWNTLDAFHNHVRDPQQIQGVGATGSYNQLIARWSLGSDLNRVSASWVPANNTVAIISSSAPSAWRLTDPYAAASYGETDLAPYGFNMDVSQDWPTEEERYFTPMPDLVGTREYTDKTRLEDSRLLGNLTNERKVERSTFDKAPLDSNRLGVFFAPTFEIDIDIARELGDSQFDDYIGNPLDLRDNSYKRLRSLRQHYWYKHQNPHDFYDYIKILRHLDHTLFKQIEQIVPARCNAQIGLLVKPNMLERPKVAHMHVERYYNNVNGRIKIEPVQITAGTTEVGGPVHQWLNPKNNKWSTGSAQAGTDARNVYTGFRTYSSNSFNDYALYTEQSEGELIIPLDTRTHYGHDLEDMGARYTWRYMNEFWHMRPTGQYNSNYVSGSKYQVSTFYQMQTATYENNYEFFHNVGQSTLTNNYYAISNLVDRQSTETHGTLSPSTAFKHYSTQANITPRHSGKPISAGMALASRSRQPFNDFGNIPNYYRQKMSRIYSTPKYYHFSPKNNMHNSASTGGHAAPAVSMSGWSPTELANGFYRSALRPVSKSYERAEVQDYRPHAVNNLHHGGCKLIGSDFNMPVLDTVDGGPVVEFTDTSPNRIMVVNRTSQGGDIMATAQQQTRGI